MTRIKGGEIKKEKKKKHNNVPCNNDNRNKGKIRYL